MAWWLSGLPAMGANLMLDCGPAPDPQRLEALARRLRGFEVPAGWLIWPDQCPALQQSVVRASGFQACERLWLARLAAGELSAAPEPSLAPPLSIRRLIPRDAPALTELYRVAHQIPPCFAGVSARAFVSQLPTVLSTYGGFVPVDGSPQLELVAAITVVLESPPRGHQEAERAGLVGNPPPAAPSRHWQPAHGGGCPVVGWQWRHLHPCAGIARCRWLVSSPWVSLQRLAGAMGS